MIYNTYNNLSPLSFFIRCVKSLDIGCLSKKSLHCRWMWISSLMYWLCGSKQGGLHRVFDMLRSSDTFEVDKQVTHDFHITHWDLAMMDCRHLSILETCFLLGCISRLLQTHSVFYIYNIVNCVCLDNSGLIFIQEGVLRLWRVVVSTHKMFGWCDIFSLSAM